MQSETIARAQGRWPTILVSLGIPRQHLRNRHGPCPLCGGRDRFRFDDKDGSGSYFCNQCGAGGGITLLQKFHNWSFKEAADEIDRILDDAPIIPHKPNRQSRDQRETIERTLREARSPNVTPHYLASRGLTSFPNVLKGDDALAYYDNRHFVGCYPAMIAPVHNLKGEIVSVHRTYIADLDPRKKLMPPTGGENAIKGAAVRLYEPSETLGVAEGIETAIACYELHGIPTWAAISSTILESFQPPTEIRQVVIFGDNDVNFTGQFSTYKLAKRLYNDGYSVEARMPKQVGDWLDVLNRRRQ